eukprot:2995278-Pyramimonas_sp.AAC.1
MEEKYDKEADPVLEAVASEGFKVVAGTPMYKRFYLWLNNQAGLKAEHDKKSREEKAKDRADWARTRWEHYSETGRGGNNHLTCAEINSVNGGNWVRGLTPTEKPNQ